MTTHLWCGGFYTCNHDARFSPDNIAGFNAWLTKAPTAPMRKITYAAQVIEHQLKTRFD